MLATTPKPLAASCIGSQEQQRCTPSCAQFTRQTSRRSQRRVQTWAEVQGEGFGSNIRRLAKKLTGSLPVIGLVSRWAATEGGVGEDVQAYPEFSRQVFDAAPEGFQIAVADLQTKYGKAAQRRFVLIVLWMARKGAGVLPGKSIVDAARRLRVSADLEFEMERFGENLSKACEKYTYMERPRGSVQQQADVAVDALARLVLGLKDGQPVSDEDAPLLVECACGGFWDVPEFRAEVQRSIAEREQRSAAYV